MPDKTKATLQGSQSINSKRIGIQNTTLIGLVNLESGNPASFRGIPVSVMLAAQSGEVLRSSDADAQINHPAKSGEALRVTQSHAQNSLPKVIGSVQNRLSLSKSVTRLRENTVVTTAGGPPEKSGDCRVKVIASPEMAFGIFLLNFPFHLAESFDLFTKTLFGVNNLLIKHIRAFPVCVCDDREAGTRYVAGVEKNANMYVFPPGIFKFDFISLKSCLYPVKCFALSETHCISPLTENDSCFRFSVTSFYRIFVSRSNFLQTVANTSFAFLPQGAGGTEMNLTARNITATMIIRNTHLRIVYPFNVQCLEKNRNIQNATVITTIKTDCHGLIISWSPLQCGYQPFGSIPRFFSSALPSSFNQLARLVPSPFASNSNCSFNSGGMRTWNAGALPVPFGCLSRLMIVDMCVPIDVMFLLIGTYLIMVVSKKTTPRTVGAVPRRLTNPLCGVTNMAEEQHTQTRPKFTWRFLAVGASTPDMRPIILYTNAPTEEEARENCPGWILYFAARLPLCIPESVGVNHA